METLYYYNLVKNFVELKKKDLIKLLKFSHLNMESSVNEFIELMRIKSFEGGKLFQLSKGTILFTSDSHINRKQDIKPIVKEELLEFKKKYYSIQSFTTIDNIQLSLANQYLGNYYNNFGRMFIFQTHADLNLLDLGSTLSDRANASVYFSELILGKDYKSLNCLEKEFCCYKKSCNQLSLGEGVINFFLELMCNSPENKLIDGIKRYDSHEKAEGIEYMLLRCSDNVLKLCAIVLNEIIFYDIKSYEKFAIEYIRILNELNIDHISLKKRIDVQEWKVNIIKSLSKISHNSFYQSQ